MFVSWRLHFSFGLFGASLFATSDFGLSFAKLIIRHGRRPLGTINGKVERDGLILPLFLLAHFLCFLSFSKGSRQD